jgi:hypothetical protein
MPQTLRELRVVAKRYERVLAAKWRLNPTLRCDKIVAIMPFPLIPLVADALVGKASSKEEKKMPVNGRVKKDGKRAKAHLREPNKKSR